VNHIPGELGGFPSRQSSTTSTSVVAKVVLNWTGTGLDPTVMGWALIHKSFAGACASATCGKERIVERLKIVAM
jgi:hypothetical protein